jgi:predicted ATPase
MRFRFGDCELDEELFELRVRGAKIAVQPKVLSLLFFLVRERTRAVTRRELLEAVWSDVVVGDASLSRAIVEARRAIGDDKQEMIVTVRGHGFRFAAQVGEVAAEPRAEPAIAPSFVGRDAHVAALTARLEHAFGGRESIVWVTGDAGIGKTRLAEEFATIARGRGARVYVTRCHEKPPLPPYWPWAHLLRAMAADRPEAEAEALRAAQERLTPNADIAVFEQVTHAITSAAAPQPIVLFFDDVHWADEPSLSLLRFFSREARDARVLVVCAYRDTALGDTELARTLGSLLREYGSVSIPLRGLSREDTARLVAALKGQLPPTKFTDALFERTGGCPLFVHQVLETEWAQRALADNARSIASSIDLQNGLMESIGRHLDGVTERCRDVLVNAAVLGKDFDFAPLASATGLARDALLDTLDDAARARLVHKSKEGRYRFVHPLIADVLYKQLSASERATRHRAAGEALVAFHRDALDVHAAHIAHHFFKAAPAGTAREAYDYSVRAAEHASLRGDARAAVSQWQQAGRALDFIPSSDALRLDVQMHLARARGQAGDADGAREAFLDAAMLARALGRSEALAESALGFAELSPKADSRRDALIGEATAALGRATGDDAKRLAARLAALAKAG